MTDQPEEMIEVTRDLLARAATSAWGEGYIKRQFDVLNAAGIDGGTKGWLKRMVGTRVPKSVWDQFVAAGNAMREKNYRNAGLDVADGPARAQYLAKLRAGRVYSAELALKVKASMSNLVEGTYQARSAPIKVHEKSNFISKDKRDELFQDPIYKVVRAAVLRKAPWCKLCGMRPPEAVLHVDHIVPLTVDWSRRMDPNNLQVLCADCNVGKSNYWS